MSRPTALSLAVLTTVLLAVALAVAPVVAPGGAATAKGKPAPLEEYVALGDSWSADVVLLDGNGGPDPTYAPPGSPRSGCRSCPKTAGSPAFAAKGRATRACASPTR